MHVPGGTLVVCHSHSRHFINNLHRDVGGVVAEDRVPDPALMAQLLRAAGLEPSSIVDGTDRYVAVARRIGDPRHPQGDNDPP